MQSNGSNGFRERVYAAVRRIPARRVMTYGQVARAIDNPHASRAVGQALRMNPCSWMSHTEASARRAGFHRTPCHRVVRSDGSIGNYTMRGSNRPRRKLSLLQQEGVVVRNGRIDLRRFGWR